MEVLVGALVLGLLLASVAAAVLILSLAGPAVGFLAGWALGEAVWHGLTATSADDEPDDLPDFVVIDVQPVGDHREQRGAA